MIEVLTNLEYLLSLQFLVELGDFYAAKCADIGGEWVRLADNSYECIETNLDDKINNWLEDKGLL